MPIPGWIRDILGIRKDFVETKKSLLEVAKLQDEACQRELIVRATREDIEKYDPNTLFLLRSVTEDALAQRRRKILENWPDNITVPPQSNDGDLSPDDPDSIRDVMGFAGCSEETARQLLERLVKTASEFKPDN